MYEEILKFLSVALAGGWLGSVITSYFSVRRERDTRIRNFRGYLAELRSRLERLSHEESKIHILFDDYIELVHRFHSERAKVTGDFRPVGEFKRLCKRFGELRYEAIANDPQKRVPRDVIIETVDDLIHFTNEYADSKPSAARTYPSVS